MTFNNNNFIYSKNNNNYFPYEKQEPAISPRFIFKVGCSGMI